MTLLKVLTLLIQGPAALFQMAPRKEPIRIKVDQNRRRL